MLLPTKAFEQLMSRPPERYVAALLDLTNASIRGVLGRLDGVGQGPWADGVTIGGDVQVQRLVGSVGVVDLPPSAEGSLGMIKVAQIGSA